LADDLTGACDAGAAFLRAGCPVRIWFGSSPLFAAPEPVQAFNTDSRALTAHRAARVVSIAATALKTTPDALFFKKVDSAARGPLAAELLAAHSALGTRAILLAPAFPAAGRTVRDSILEIEDAAGQQKQVDLVELFPREMRHRVAPLAAPQEIVAALDARCQVLVCDASTQQDLEELVRIAESYPGLLYAGSAGLAQAIAGRHASPAQAAALPKAERTLIVAGSDHPVTKLQLSVLDGTRFEGVRLLRIGRRRDSARILREFKAHAPQALILTGGDTALLAVQALGAHSFALQGEFAPGIPWGIVQGGVADGAIVFTKSGGFGVPTVFNDILAALGGAA
jgi:uncharacterized protein YgbK (DUF1537 family)